MKQNRPVTRWEGPASLWADQLWAHAARLARGMTGEQVVRALSRSADDVYNAGLDELFDQFRTVSFEERGALWDATWLPVFLTALHSERCRSRRARRTKGRSTG